jgi:predicted HNH restriction endonuclease
MNAGQEFEQLLVANYRRVGDVTGYWANYFKRDIKTIGGVATAKRLLKPQKGEGLARGLKTLLDNGLSELSLERTVVNKRFQSLFTKVELREAHKRLKQLETQVQRKPKSTIEEVIRDPIRREMTIEAFERKASWARLARKLYGSSCMVTGCQFVLLKDGGEHYIEVHHIVAMFEGGSPNDKTNLSVLCPNHHREVHYAAAKRRTELTAMIRREQSRRLAKHT